MKKLPAAALAFVAALLLAGCTDAAAETPEATSAQPVAVESAPTATATTTAPRAKESGPATDAPAEARSPEEVYESALAAGRPAAAYDKDCEVWLKLPGGTPEQDWANAVADTWLASHDAGCPDGITFPDYYVETITAGEPGELIFLLDTAIMNDYVVTKNYDAELDSMGLDMLGRIYEDHPDVEQITFTIEDRTKTRTVTIEDFSATMEGSFEY